jgi:UDP-sugar transporter A1/2/3
MKEDYRNLLLLSVPAAAYNLQSSLEYVALANLDAAVFSVLVQTKLCMTAICAFLILRKKLKRIQIMSLILLTAGVMLCNLTKATSSGENSLDAPAIKGILATLGIATSSGFASVYTEKVIKAQRNVNVTRQNYSLAYMQVQLATASLIIMGLFATIKDYQQIATQGLWHNFTWKAYMTVFNSAIGGLIVAAVLKFSDSVLKGYATACSVVMTGVLSMLLFGTELNIIYFLGIINVVIAVLLYNGNAETLDQYVC